MGFIIDVESGSDRGSIIPDAGFRYNINLNQVNEAEIKISGTGVNKRGLLKIGATVYIYRNGTLEFLGIIDNTDYFVGGTVMFHASGWEMRMAREEGTYSGSPWQSTASATILAAIIGESSYITAGTIDAGFDMDFRLATSTNLYNAVTNMANKTSQDMSIDYTTSPVELSILDHVGSSTSVVTLNQGKEITNLHKSQGLPRGNKIKVYGKGDGADQIKGSDSDATSISAYGTITKTIVDRSITSSSEANRLAAAELAINKDPPQIYDFDMTNPSYTGIALGDIITLNALDQDVVSEEVRIVGIERGEKTGNEYLSLQVTNPELKTLMRTKNKVLAKIQKDAQDQNTYMQGTRVLNPMQNSEICDASNPMRIRFYIPSSLLVDEAGNNRLKSAKLSYKLDDYKKVVSITDDVTLTSVTTGNRLSSTTAPTSSTVESQSDDKANYYTQVTDFGDVEKSNIDDHNHDVSSNTSASYTLSSVEGSDTDSENVSDTSWDLVVSNVPFSGTFDFIYVYVTAEEDSWSGSDILHLRIDTGFYDIYDPGRGYYTGFGGVKFLYVIPIMGSASTSLDLYARSNANQDYDFSVEIWGSAQAHNHSIPSQSGGSSSGAEDEQVYFEKVGGSNFSITAASQDQDNIVDDTDRVYSDRVTDVTDNSSSTVTGGTTGTTVTGAILDLTEVTTTATGIKLYIDGTNRTTAVFGSDPHSEVEDEEIDITSYVNTAGWHYIEIYPQGDKAFTMAEVRFDQVIDN